MIIQMLMMTAMKKLIKNTLKNFKMNLIMRMLECNLPVKEKEDLAI